jgi:hypothetical protein
MRSAPPSPRDLSDGRDEGAERLIFRHGPHTEPPPPRRAVRESASDEETESAKATATVDVDRRQVGDEREKALDRALEAWNATDRCGDGRLFAVIRRSYKFRIVVKGVVLPQDHRPAVSIRQAQLVNGQWTQRRGMLFMLDELRMLTDAMGAVTAWAKTVEPTGNHEQPIDEEKDVAP